jgi:catechol 2,3-dioxygenase-like lactoylglutathione lyase family enzyme
MHSLYCDWAAIGIPAWRRLPRLKDRTYSADRLGNADLAAFIPTTDAHRALHFYRDTLGLELVDEDGFGLVFKAREATLRVVKVERLAPASYTVVGWRVPDLESTQLQLAAKGIAFERYPGMEQDALGAWSAPGGARIAWFKDPDGNTLSLAQLPA